MSTRLSPIATLLLFTSAAAAQQQQPAAPPRENGLYAILETSLGNITFRLLDKDAPLNVRAFVELSLGKTTYIDPRNGLPSKRPLYNGLTFHRVIPEFMIQGGDPMGDGTGGTRVIPDEFKPDVKFDQAGRVGVANSGPNTGSCQFFITEVPTPHLDGLHTVFGQVVEGLDVAARIARVPAQSDRPIEPVLLNNVRIERVGPEPEIVKPPPPAPAPAAAKPKPAAKKTVSSKKAATTKATTTGRKK